MLLPANFTSVIADTFYDKEVSILAKATTSTDGWIDEDATTVTSTFKGNVQFNRLADIQAELGLTDLIDVAITCGTQVVIEPGNLFRYNGVTYKASAVIPFDSHLKIVGSKWA